MSTRRHLGLGTFFVIWIFGGFSVAVQARANGELTQHIGNGVQAALISFTVGFVLISSALIFSRSMRTGIVRIVASVRDGSLAWWALPAGVLGGVFVASQSFAVALIGVAMFSVGIVAGQTLNSLVVDHYGLGPIGRQHITVRRVMSALIAIAAVVVTVSHQFGNGDAKYYTMFLAVFAGAVVAVQQAMNGRVSIAGRDPLSSTWMAFFFGMVSLAIGSLFGVLFTGAKAQLPTAGPWWMYLGGFMGVTFIMTASWGVPRLGVLVFALISIAGQLTAGLAFDIFVPVAGNTVTINLVIGVLMTLVAVAVGSIRRRTP